MLSTTLLITTFQLCDFYRINLRYWSIKLHSLIIENEDFVFWNDLDSVKCWERYVTENDCYQSPITHVEISERILFNFVGLLDCVEFDLLVSHVREIFLKCIMSLGFPTFSFHFPCCCNLTCCCVENVPTQSVYEWCSDVLLFVAFGWEESDQFPLPRIDGHCFELFNTSSWCLVTIVKFCECWQMWQNSNNRFDVVINKLVKSLSHLSQNRFWCDCIPNREWEVKISFFNWLWSEVNPSFQDDFFDPSTQNVTSFKDFVRTVVTTSNCCILFCVSGTLDTITKIFLVFLDNCNNFFIGNSLQIWFISKDLFFIIVREELTEECFLQWDHYGYPFLGENIQFQSPFKAEPFGVNVCCTFNEYSAHLLVIFVITMEQYESHTKFNIHLPWWCDNIPTFRLLRILGLIPICSCHGLSVIQVKKISHNRFPKLGFRLPRKWEVDLSPFQESCEFLDFFVLDLDWTFRNVVTNISNLRKHLSEREIFVPLLVILTEVTVSHSPSFFEFICVLHWNINNKVILHVIEWIHGLRIGLCWHIESFVSCCLVCSNFGYPLGSEERFLWSDLIGQLSFFFDEFEWSLELIHDFLLVLLSGQVLIIKLENTLQTSNAFISRSLNIHEREDRSRRSPNKFEFARKHVLGGLEKFGVQLSAVDFRFEDVLNIFPDVGKFGVG